MNAFIFDSPEWEFVSEVNSTRVDFSKKLNQWRHTYDLVVIDVQKSVTSPLVDFTIARKLRAQK